MILSPIQFQFLLQGALWTIGLSVIAMIGGGSLGLLIALSRVSSVRFVRYLSAFYTQIIQGTPLLVIMFMTFFGLPSMGFDVPALAAASIALIVFVSAYLGEIWRGCIESVPKAQWEAAECLALTRLQRMIYVVLPQATRLATPPTVGFAVQVVKNTSLVSVVGFVELARAAQIVNGSSYNPFAVYLAVGAIYFSICYPMSLWSRRLETRYGQPERRIAQLKLAGLQS